MQQSKTIALKTMLVRAFGYSLVYALAIPCFATEQPTPQPIGAVDLDIEKKSINLSALSDAGSRRVADTILGTNWLRLKLTLQATQPLNGITVTVYDGLDTEVESFDLSGQTNTTNWTKLFSSNQYVVRVTGPAQIDGAVAVAAVVRSTDEPEPLSIIGNDERTKIADSADQDILRVARSVVKVFFQDVDITRTCSGFLISKQRIITNHHCFHSQEVCKTATVAFDYLDDGTPPPSKQIRCMKFLNGDADLDITVLELDASIPADIQPLKLAKQSPLKGQALHLPQFPAQQPKLISSIGCMVEENPISGYAKDSDFSHTCDTVEGASGSPVLNPDLEVVGLHHLAISDVPFNRAVRIEPIKDWLQSKGLAQ
jgi:V8-like Glu-specific endopeptidase